MLLISYKSVSLVGTYFSDMADMLLCADNESAAQKRQKSQFSCQLQLTQTTSGLVPTLQSE